MVTKLYISLCWRPKQACSTLPLTCNLEIDWLSPDRAGSINMKDDQISREKTRVSGSAGNKKKVYQKPAFRCERVFETQALSCGKITSTQQNCQSNHKTS